MFLFFTLYFLFALAPSEGHLEDIQAQYLSKSHQYGSFRLTGYQFQFMSRMVFQYLKDPDNFHIPAEELKSTELAELLRLGSKVHEAYHYHHREMCALEQECFKIVQNIPQANSLGHGFQDIYPEGAVIRFVLETLHYEYEYSPKHPLGIPSHSDRYIAIKSLYSFQATRQQISGLKECLNLIEESVIILDQIRSLQGVYENQSEQEVQKLDLSVQLQSELKKLFHQFENMDASVLQLFENIRLTEYSLSYLSFVVGWSLKPNYGRLLSLKGMAQLYHELHSQNVSMNQEGTKTFALKPFLEIYNQYTVRPFETFESHLMDFYLSALKPPKEDKIILSLLKLNSLMSPPHFFKEKEVIGKYMQNVTVGVSVDFSQLSEHWEAYFNVLLSKQQTEEELQDIQSRFKDFMTSLLKYLDAFNERQTFLKTHVPFKKDSHLFLDQFALRSLFKREGKDTLKFLGKNGSKLLSLGLIQEDLSNLTEDLLGAGIYKDPQEFYPHLVEAGVKVKSIQDYVVSMYLLSDGYKKQRIYIGRMFDRLYQERLKQVQNDKKQQEEKERYEKRRDEILKDMWSKGGVYNVFEIPKPTEPSKEGHWTEQAIDYLKLHEGKDSSLLMKKYENLQAYLIGWQQRHGKDMIHDYSPDYQTIFEFIQGGTEIEQFIWLRECVLFMREHLTRREIVDWLKEFFKMCHSYQFKLFPLIDVMVDSVESFFYSYANDYLEGMYKQTMAHFHLPPQVLGRIEWADNEMKRISNQDENKLFPLFLTWVSLNRDAHKRMAQKMPLPPVDYFAQTYLKKSQNAEEMFLYITECIRFFTNNLGSGKNVTIFHMVHWLSRLLEECDAQGFMTFEKTEMKNPRVFFDLEALKYFQNIIDIRPDIFFSSQFLEKNERSKDYEWTLNTIYEKSDVDISKFIHLLSHLYSLRGQLSIDRVFYKKDSMHFSMDSIQSFSNYYLKDKTEDEQFIWLRECVLSFHQKESYGKVIEWLSLVFQECYEKGYRQFPHLPLSSELPLSFDKKRFFNDYAIRYLWNLLKTTEGLFLSEVENEESQQRGKIIEEINAQAGDDENKYFALIDKLSRIEDFSRDHYAFYQAGERDTKVPSSEDIFHQFLQDSSEEELSIWLTHCVFFFQTQLNQKELIEWLGSIFQKCNQYGLLSFEKPRFGESQKFFFRRYASEYFQKLFTKYPFLYYASEVQKQVKTKEEKLKEVLEDYPFDHQKLVEEAGKEEEKYRQLSEKWDNVHRYLVNYSGENMPSVQVFSFRFMQDSSDSEQFTWIRQVCFEFIGKVSTDRIVNWLTSLFKACYQNGFKQFEGFDFSSSELESLGMKPNQDTFYREYAQQYFIDVMKVSPELFSSYVKQRLGSHYESLSTMKTQFTKENRLDSHVGSLPSFMVQYIRQNQFDNWKAPIEIFFKELHQDKKISNEESLSLLTRWLTPDNVGIDTYNRSEFQNWLVDIFVLFIDLNQPRSWKKVLKPFFESLFEFENKYSSLYVVRNIHNRLWKQFGYSPQIGALFEDKSHHTFLPRTVDMSHLKNTPLSSV